MSSTAIRVVTLAIIAVCAACPDTAQGTHSREGEGEGTGPVDAGEPVADTTCGHLCAAYGASGCTQVALYTCSTTKVWRVAQFDQHACEIECEKVDSIVPSQCAGPLEALLECGTTSAITCDANGFITLDDCADPFNAYVACCPPPPCDPSACGGCLSSCDDDFCSSCCSSCGESGCVESCTD